MKKFDIQRFAKRRVQIGDNLRNKKIYLDISNLDNDYFNDRWIQLSEVPRDIIKCGDISLLQEYPESNNDNIYSQLFSLTLLDNTVTLYKVGSNDSSWNPIEEQLEYQMPNDKDYIITETIGYGNDTANYASLLCFYVEDVNIRPVQSGDIIDENTKTYINFPYKYSKEWSQEQSFNFIMNTEEEDNKIVMVFNYENNLLSITDGGTFSTPFYGTSTHANLEKSLPIGTVIGFSIEEVPYNANNYILVDTTTLGKAPLVSVGTVSYKNNGNWNKLLSLAQEQIPLRGSIIPGPIKWSAVNSTAECTDSKTLYFVFGEEETNPIYETVNMRYTISNSAYNIASISSIGLIFNNDSNSKTILNYNNESNSFLPGIETKYINNTLPQIFIDYTGEQLTVYGEIAVRDSETTGLLYVFLLNQQNVISGQPITFESDSSGISFSEAIHSGSVSCTLYINSASGQACLSEDTKIKTLNNDIYISDLELGDKVIDRDNQETEITKIYNHKISTVYQIHLDNNETIECSYDHRFLINGGKATTAAQLKENDKIGQYIITSINIINKELDVYEIKTESNTYTLANGIICECENI